MNKIKVVQSNVLEYWSVKVNIFVSVMETSVLFYAFTTFTPAEWSIYDFYLVMPSCVKKIHLESVGTKLEIFGEQILYSRAIISLGKKTYFYRLFKNYLNLIV